MRVKEPWNICLDAADPRKCRQEGQEKTSISISCMPQRFLTAAAEDIHTWYVMKNELVSRIQSMWPLLKSLFPPLYCFFPLCQVAKTLCIFSGCSLNVSSKGAGPAEPTNLCFFLNILKPFKSFETDVLN